MADLKVTDPRHMDFQYWADLVFANNIGIPQVRGYNHWRDWAIRVYETYAGTPDPYQFNDWIGWAERTRQSVNG